MLMANHTFIGPLPSRKLPAFTPQDTLDIIQGLSWDDIYAGVFPRGLAYAIWYWGYHRNTEDRKILGILVASRVRRHLANGYIGIRATVHPLHPESVSDRSDIIGVCIANRLEHADNLLANAHTTDNLAAYYYGTFPVPTPKRPGSYTRGCKSIDNVILAYDRRYHNKARTPVESRVYRRASDGIGWDMVDTRKNDKRRYRAVVRRYDWEGTPTESQTIMIQRIAPNRIADMFAFDSDSAIANDDRVYDDSYLQTLKSIAEHSWTDAERLALYMIIQGKSNATCRKCGVAASTIASVKNKVRELTNVSY
jgi:hypothetical protein